MISIAPGVSRPAVLHFGSKLKFFLWEPGITVKHPSPEWLGVSMVATFNIGDRITLLWTVYSSVGSPLCHPVAPRPSYFEIDQVFTSCGSPMNSWK